MSQRRSVCSASLINFTCRGQTIKSLLLRLKTPAPAPRPAPPPRPTAQPRLKGSFSLPFFWTFGHSDISRLRHIVRPCIRPFHVEGNRTREHTNEQRRPSLAINISYCILHAITAFNCAKVRLLGAGAARSHCHVRARIPPRWL